MARSRVIAAATAAIVGALSFGALSLGSASDAEAGGYRHRDGGVIVYYPTPYDFHSGYRPHYGPYYRGYYDPYYGRPRGIFRPAGIVYRPFHAEPSPIYCRGWGWVYSKCGKYARWRCLNW